MNNLEKSTFICNRLREFGAKGIIIYNERITQRVYVVGYPYSELVAVNDNEVTK